LAFNGSGTFNRVHSWVTDKANTVVVTASRMDAEDDGFATGLSSCIVKDGQQTTTARIPFALGTSAFTGATSGVSYSFTSDPNTGLYSPAADQWGLVAGGTEVLTGAATVVTAAVPVKFPDGAVDAPSVTFTNDTDCGIYRIGANNIGIAVNGAKQIDIGTANVTFTNPTLAPDGAVGAPAYAFTNDTDCGVYRINTNNIGIAVNGAKVLDIGTAGLGVTGTLTSSGALTVSSGGATVTGNSTITGSLTVSTSISGATVTGDMVATQSQMETPSASNLIVTPARLGFHPGVAKAFTLISSSGTAVVSGSLNVSSVTKNGTGDYTITFTTSFSSTNYVCFPVSYEQNRFGFIISTATGSVRVGFMNVDGNFVDPTTCAIACFGDQ
jgi:hypothetical protein